MITFSRARHLRRGGGGVNAHAWPASACSQRIVVLLVLGVMNLAVMAFVSAAITIERLAPHPEIVARAIGIAVIAAGAIVVFV